MKQKTVVMIQGLVSLVLTILMAVSAFLPVFNVRVQPGEELLTAVQEVLLNSLAADAEDIEDEDDIKALHERYETYAKKFEESIEYERELTDEENEKALEFSLKEAMLKAKLDTREAMYSQLNSNSNSDAEQKAEIQKQIDKLEAEITEDFKAIEFYEIPVRQKGYPVSVSPLGILINISKWQGLCKMVSRIMSRNEKIEKLAAATDKSERESIQKGIDEDISWLKENNKYYKDSVTEETLGIVCFFDSVIGLHVSSSNTISDKNEIKGMYELAFTDKVFEQQNTVKIVSAVMALIFTYIYIVYAVFAALITLIGALLSLKDKQKLYCRAIAGFRHMTLAGGILLLSLAFMGGASLAAGGILCVVCLVLGVVANGLAARTRRKEGTEEVYLDIVQGWGLLAFIGLLIACVSLGMNGFISSLYDRKSVVGAVQHANMRMASVLQLSSMLLLMLFIVLFISIGVVLLFVSLSNKARKSKKPEKIKKRASGLYGRINVGLLAACGGNVVCSCGFIV